MAPSDSAIYKKVTEDVNSPKRVEMIIEKVRRLAEDNNVNPNIVEVVYRNIITE